MSNRCWLALAFVLFAVPCFSQSSKETILNDLTICQVKLAQAQVSMSNSERKILILNDETSNLQQQLMDSANKSQTTINEISRQLLDSKALLQKSQAELVQQAEQLKKLSKELTTLKLKSAISNSLPWVIDGVIIITAGVIVYYERK